MSTPIQQPPSYLTTPSSSLNSLPSISAAPVGIGATPSSIETGSSSICHYLSAIGMWFYSAGSSVWESIGSGFNYVLSWFNTESQPPLAPVVTLPIPTPSPLPAPQLLTSTASPSGSSAPLDPFLTLPLSLAEQEKIAYIIHTVAVSGASLIFQQAALEQKGREIDHVHPLKFLEYIFRHPTLPQDLNDIHQSIIPMKWSRFIDGLSTKMQREAANLPNYLPGFAHSLGINVSDLHPFISERRWADMVVFLLHVKLGRIQVAPIQSPPAAPTPAVTPTIPAPVAAPSIVPTPPSYTDIHLSESEKSTITVLLAIYAHKSTWALSTDYLRLRRLWQEMGNANCLKLLAFMITTPELLNELKVIFSYRVTRYLFMSNLSAVLCKSPPNQVIPFIDGFAQEVRIGRQGIASQIAAGQWQELLTYILTLA